MKDNNANPTNHRLSHLDARAGHLEHNQTHQSNPTHELDSNLIKTYSALHANTYYLGWHRLWIWVQSNWSPQQQGCIGEKRPTNLLETLLY